MVKVIIAILSLTSTYAFACPQIEGKYSCQYSDGSSDTVEITQKTENNSTVYQLGAAEVIADGKSHPVDQEELKGTYVASCSGDKVSAAVTGKVYDNNQPVADVTMNIIVSKTAAGANIEQSGEFKVGEDLIPFNDQAVCTKN